MSIINQIISAKKDELIRFSQTSLKDHDLVVTKIALLVIKLCLIPFQLIQESYHKVFKGDKEKKLAEGFFSQLKPINELANNKVKALIGITALAIVTLIPRSPIATQNIQLKAISESTLLPKLILGTLLTCLIGSYARKLKSSNSKKDSLKVTQVEDFLPKDLALFEGDFLTESSLANFQKAINIEKSDYDDSKNNSANRALNKITESETCRDAFKHVLEDVHLSNAKKLEAIKFQLRSEAENFGIDHAIESPDSIISFTEGSRKEHVATEQIKFADLLIEKLKSQEVQVGDLIDEVEEPIETIKASNRSQFEKANEINSLLTNLIRGQPVLRLFITSLDFSDALLTAILPCVFEVRGLTELNLKNNRLTFIPNEINNLQSLKNLTLDNNKLTLIPSGVRNLVDLEILSLRSNQIRHIPDNFFTNLTNINNLSLSINQLRQIPSSIKGLTSLQYFSSSGNKIKEIDDDFFSELTNLKSISIGYNFLEKIPNSIRHIQSLHRLGVMYNPIHNIPDDFFENLTGLRDIALSGIPIKKLPRSLKKLKNLKRFYIGQHILLDNMNNDLLEKISILVDSNHLNFISTNSIIFKILNYLKNDILRRSLIELLKFNPFRSFLS